MRLKTNYSVGLPHGEHPAPQAKRENWLCLNGLWAFYKKDKTGNRAFEGDILVPFSPETLLSGVDEKFRLERGETLVYKRTVVLEENMLLGVTKLHFGAVDSECEVFVNGEKAGGHVVCFGYFFACQARGERDRGFLHGRGVI